VSHRDRPCKCDCFAGYCLRRLCVRKGSNARTEKPGTEKTDKGQGTPRPRIVVWRDDMNGGSDEDQQ
jgi:hypothetical protein